MNIYVGNLSFDMTEDELRQAFESFGHVESAKIIMDGYSGRSKGFGFVEMANDSEGKTAMADLNGKELKGRVLKCDEARPRNDSGGRSDSRRY
jgi:RNA recognition motif-containing protein